MEASPSNNLIKRCLERSLDPENYSKFQQVLEYLGEQLYIPLYCSYNENLKLQLQALGVVTQFPPGITIEQHISLKANFFSFRFIKDVGHFIHEKKDKGAKANANFITLLKILLFHSLTSKDYTANLALVEFEQLRIESQLSLQSLYQEYRTKFLRLIIKAVLHKLMTDSQNDQASTSGSYNSNGTSTAGTSRTSWQAKSNRAILYMTRALEVFNITTITKDDVAKSLIITTNLILKEKYNEAIKRFLTYLANYQNIDLCTLIGSHIQAIVVSLLIRRKLSTYDMTASLNKLCSFCDKTPGQLLATKFTFIKARLLLNYHREPKSVTESIYYLTKFELKEHEQPFEDEFEEEKHFIDYLDPSMIGILLGVDSHFTACKKDLGSDECLEQIKSLEKLLSLLSESQVQVIHVKLLSTLNLLLRLRPTRDNQRLNKAIKDIWIVFLSKLGTELKTSLLINICVALFDLVEDCPEEVADIYHDLLCKQNPKNLAKQLKSLFFIPDIPPMKHIYDILTPFVCRKNSFTNLQELEQTFDCVLPLMQLGNQRCRLIALNRLRELLSTNKNLIISSMLKNLDEPLDKCLSRVIESLIALCCTQDSDCSALIAECLGLLGAVNPVRLDHLIYGEILCKDSSGITHLTDPIFIVDLIERLKNSLFSDQRSESETANYALQVIVEKFSVLTDPKISTRLSAEAKRACHICKNTSYIGSKRTQPDLTVPVFSRFKQDSIFSYRDWLDKFALNTISMIREKRIQEVLYACSYLFKYNLKIAEHLLSYAVIHVIVHQTAHLPNTIKKEIMAIIDEDAGVSSQDLTNLYLEDTRGSIQTLHFQCANMVFCVLDSMHRLVAKSKCKESPITLNPRQHDSLRDFICSFPKDKLAILASKCRSHARALYYFDQYLFENKDKLDKYATALQRIYVALDDSFEAAGIEMVRTSPTTIYDDVANYEACGRFDKAFICCDISLDNPDTDVDRESFIDHALRCLSNQGDYQRLYEKSRRLIDDYVHQKRNILPYAIEATWNLGKWDELENTFKVEPIDNLLERANVGQGYLIASLSESLKSAKDNLNIVRSCLIKPLSIAMMDHSAYFRGYHNFLTLHSVGDFTLSLDIFDTEYVKPELLDENSIDGSKLLYYKKMDALLELWNFRNKLVQPSLRSLEPLLAWQRAISLILAKKYPALQERTSIDIGQMWLKSADSAREVRSFDKSFFCLTQAQKWFGSKFDRLDLNLRIDYYIEQAKLNWDQGEKTKAIRCLKLSIERLKDHNIYKHLSLRRETDRSSDNFPKLDAKATCKDCCRISLQERESFARLKILLTQYCEEAAAGIPQTLFFMYEECVHLGVNQEETYLRLARYYDKLLAYYMENPALCGEQSDTEQTQRFSQNLLSKDKEEVYTKLMEHSIIAFGHSLKYGVRYIRESMTRLLNIWYDLGSKKLNPLCSSIRNLSTRIESTTRLIEELKGCVPPYYFMTAISILISRISHRHSGVSKKTQEIMEFLLVNFPHQITWHLLAAANDTENDDRRKAAFRILNSSRRSKNFKVEKVVKDTMDFSKIVQEVCISGAPEDKRARPQKLGQQTHMKDICPSALKFDFEKATVMLPVEASMRAIIPIDTIRGTFNIHLAFPGQADLYIKSFKPMVRVYNSLQQPKSVNFQCVNGKEVDLMFKYGDDLRKDSRCTEFLGLLNRILRRNNQSNARFFEIQTFLVLPIEKAAGIIEMVPNLDTMRSIIEALYKERNRNFIIHDIYANKPKQPKEAYIKEMPLLYQNQVLPKMSPPVLPTWFLRNFTEPTSWYMARLAYTRTAAVSSMAGYIIGLGDRHLDNVLIDIKNGRIVHVDFNLLFHQAENFAVPERVPFRLTHNFVAAFGPMGTEGNFRKVSEITMRVMREEKDLLLTTLKPFMHDPCSDWVKQRGDHSLISEPEDKHAENRTAKSRIEVVERKLKGFPRSMKFKPLTLIDSYSVEAQVDNLIEEATDIYNLAYMYYGWCPHI